MIQVYIGIDPGKTGAVAALQCDAGTVSAKVWDYDDQEGMEGLEWLVQAGCYNIKACVEKQQAWPKQGVSSVFKLGENYGRWQGRLEVLKISYELVTPAMWRKGVFDAMPKQEDKKAMSLDLARRLFPELVGELKRKKDHGRAEALLIAEWLRRKSV